LSVLLADAVEPSIAQHGGRIVKNTGDGLVAEFGSAVEAMRAATELQERVHDLTNGDAADKRIAFRVGINIGDIIVEPHDIFGDGVNIAARLEGIAEPGGICISSSAYDQVRGKVPVEFVDLGEQNLKNIAHPVRAYAVVSKGDAPKIQGNAPNSGPASRLSIVVLPFINFSGDPEQEYFVDGVTENLTTDLSRIAGSLVIARSTAFTFKGKAVDVRQAGRDLNVRYALEGSVQRGSNFLRVNVQLIDAETGNHLWAERFDKPVADLFEMQDEIVSRLANELNARLIAAEARRAEQLQYHDAIDCVFQGRASLNRGPTLANAEQARTFFQKALVLDPDNVEALVGTAIVGAILGANLYTDDRAVHLAAAEAAVTRALFLEPGHAVAHGLLGVVQMSTNRVIQGIAECEQALALDRNLANAHGSIGFGKYLLGRAEETETHIGVALRLSPFDINAFRWLLIVGSAKIQLGADAEAATWLRRSIEANRSYHLAHFYLAAVLALLGDLDHARTALRVGLAIDPRFNLRRFRTSIVSDNPVCRAGRERIHEGMRMAGVPEG
jgi:TolB-like protein